MKARHIVAALTAMVATQADVSALTPPSKGDGPVRLLACVVSPGGLLEAEVDNTSDAMQTCDIRCDYAVAGTTFSHWFEVTIPSRFNGPVGRFDTSGGMTGSYSGDIGTCQKMPSH